MTAAGERVLFADVDETIIRGKSLLQFVRYAATFAPDDEVGGLHDFVKTLVGRAQDGAPREELNAAYYARVLRGRAIANVGRAADAWYLDASAAPEFLKQSSLRFLRSARQTGAAIVLVSGSFRELVAPIGEVVGAADIIVAELEASSGLYTGRLIGSPVVGEGKAKAVSAYADAKRLDLKTCIGLGDDVTDLPFLRLLGMQYAPADAHPEMLDLIRGLGGRILERD